MSEKRTNLHSSSETCANTVADRDIRGQLEGERGRVSVDQVHAGSDGRHDLLVRKILNGREFVRNGAAKRRTGEGKAATSRVTQVEDTAGVFTLPNARICTYIPICFKLNIRI